MICELEIDRSRSNKCIGFLFASVLLFLFSEAKVSADILVLKNGRQIYAENIWEENGIVKFSLYGAIVGYPKEMVERIIQETAPDRGALKPFYPWSIGQGIEEVMAICDRFDIPLSREGLVSSHKGFNSKMCRPYIHTHTRFTYDGIAYNYPSKYTLVFDPLSKTLKEIGIRISKPTNEMMDVFLHKIATKLSDSNNKPVVSGLRKIWEMDENQIVLTAESHGANIKYSIGPIHYPAEVAKNVTVPNRTEPKPKLIPEGSQKALDSSSIIKTMLGPFIVTAIIIAALLYLKIVIGRKVARLFSVGFKAGKRMGHSGHSIFTEKSNEVENADVYERADGLFTLAEKDFLSVLKVIIGDRYTIQGKVRLADIITPETNLSDKRSMWAFRRISQKHVDFVICDKYDYKILGVIELDDKSHLRPDRIARDKFVDAALAAADIPILHVPVNSDYSITALQAQFCIHLGLNLGTWPKDQINDIGEEIENDDALTTQSDDLGWSEPKFKI